MTDDQFQEAGRIRQKIDALEFHLENVQDRAATEDDTPHVVDDLVQALQWKELGVDRRTLTLVSPSTIREIRAMIRSDLAQQLDRARTKFAAL